VWCPGNTSSNHLDSSDWKANGINDLGLGATASSAKFGKERRFQALARWRLIAAFDRRTPLLAEILGHKRGAAGLVGMSIGARSFSTADTGQPGFQPVAD
jgi:hypothetical protein